MAGQVGAVETLIAVPPLALFTRYFLERRLSALHDVRTFFVLGSRKRLKQRLVDEGRELADEVEQLVTEFSARVA